MKNTNKQEPRGILLITGTVGSGKTTVAEEVGEQLAEMSLPNAVIDLDWLGWVNVGNGFNKYDQLIMQNVIAAWPNYRSVGVQYLVMARILLQREHLGEIESMNAILDGLHLEGATVENEGHSVEETAKQTIKFTGWK